MTVDTPSNEQAKECIIGQRNSDITVARTYKGVLPAFTWEAGWMAKAPRLVSHSASEHCDRSVYMHLYDAVVVGEVCIAAMAC